MVNKGNKKVRHIKNTGSVYYDNAGQQWVGQVEIGKYQNGRVKYKRFKGKSQEDVILRMKMYKQEHQVIQDDAPANETNFKDFMESYIKTIKKNKLKPSSYVRDYSTFKNNVSPYLGGYTLDKITPLIIQRDLIQGLIDNNYSYSTIHKAYVLTRECLSYAYKQQLIERNPCDFVEKPSKRGLQESKTIRFFDDDEINRFIEAALSKHGGAFNYRNGYAFIILIYTGLRAGEMLALKWQDVDLDNNFIRVSSNIGVKFTDDESNSTELFVQDGTKTKSGRIVHLTKSAHKYFSELKNLRDPKRTDFVVEANTQTRSMSILRNSYLGICKRANIENAQGLHTLRHTFASLMIRKGVDIKIISEMLGHASVSFTYNTYVHLLEEEKAKVIQQIDI